MKRSYANDPQACFSLDHRGGKNFAFGTHHFVRLSVREVSRAQHWLFSQIDHVRLTLESVAKADIPKRRDGPYPDNEVRDAQFTFLTGGGVQEPERNSDFGE
jgi:hypothetical protein